MATGLIWAEQGFRRVHGYHRLGELAVALGRAPAASPASASEEVAAAPSSCAPAGLAAE
ncbi:MAG: hypothetical protein DVB23_002122 [Verrucomicrobia bacterium]|nr:MAG: hypothetical protein DVB23_002122 [Verrucomicrobiota bacterium]